MTTKTERYSRPIFARIGKRAIQIMPTLIDRHGKYLNDPDYDEIDLLAVCPRCGIQGMALSSEMRPPLKGKKNKRRAMVCKFCGIRTVRWEHAPSPLLNIDELPEFDPNDDKMYSTEMVASHDFED